ncbi:MAG: hypothetical protein A3F84_24835 [Candidatus Handelsmanbacteria bacterium RIFCSPLOWO2_12_FULL_64_10]|uniref:Enoyl reductase (ER) domain-containing protein n=1 Tax=Handelsmanbacteria sp. (strain RIFCSPLOWO2_12_FULL_64_10) TaxID=1817868 RepID=A0A1F6D480_HANXR|nr:MAG: hypothetical protein A3F84_24835 [Candidatus Handelsmanbacteria bacterium RIFCSPLOWO2_12_FULL_64_10]
MKGVMAWKPGAEVALGDLTEPVPGEYEALVRMDACGICNSTDQKLVQNRFCPGPFPIILGHEVVGTVVETGSKVKHFKPGDRVFRQRLPKMVEPDGIRSVWGGLAELGLITDEWARRGVPYGPESFPGDQQKLLIQVEPALAAAMITLMETLDCAASNCGIKAGQTVAIVGTGPVGQAFALFARLLGADSVHVFARTNRYARRFEQISRCDSFTLGDDDSAEARNILAKGGFDVVIEAVGSPDALRRAVALAGHRGAVFVYGVAGIDHPFPQDLLARPNVKRVGAKEGRAQRRLVDFIEAGKVDLNDWVSHRLPVSACQQGLDLVMNKEAFKVVLTA